MLNRLVEIREWPESFRDLGLQPGRRGVVRIAVVFGAVAGLLAGFGAGVGAGLTAGAVALGGEQPSLYVVAIF